MANYAGETFRITVVSSDFDGQSLIPDDIDAMYVTITTAAGSLVVDETEMTWSAEEELWFYIWDTTNGATPSPLSAGTYRVKCRLLDLDGHSSWEYKNVRLKANPS